MELKLSEVSQILRQSSKGKLVYNREEKFDFIFNDVDHDNKLISIHPSCLKIKLNNSVSDSEVEDHTKFKAFPDHNHDIERIDLHLTDSLNFDNVVTENDSINELIHDYEMNQRQETQRMLDDKRNSFKVHNETSYRKSLLAFHTNHIVKMRNEYMKSTKLAEKIQARQLEIEEKIGKLKNTHKSRAKESADRLEQASLQDQREAEAHNKKSLEIQQRINDFTTSGRKLFLAYQEMAQLIKSHEDIKLLPHDIRQTVHAVNEIMNQFHKMVKQFNNRVLERHDVELIQELEKTTENYLETIKISIAEISKKQAEIEESQSRTSAKASLPSEQSFSNNSLPPKEVAGVRSAVENDGEALKKFKFYMDLKTKSSQIVDEMKKDQSLKVYRNDLQKTINVLVNAISVQSGSHLLDKMLKLSQLLAGQHLPVMNNRKVSVLSHPLGKQFCLDLMAKKFLTQGEDAISSSHAAAYPIASVVIGLWKADPNFGEILLAHIFSKCPHLIPYRLPHLDNQSEEEYKVTLGYDVIDGVMESEERFLKRISGITRLYAAIMFSPLPRGTSPPHPYAINHTWAWITRTINMNPIPGVTAAALFDILDACGCSLSQTYGRQFHKLLTTIYREYFTKIQLTTPADLQAPTSRLETFLQTYMKQGRILPPQGVLPPNFWMT